MTIPDTMSPLDQLRLRERQLELDAVAIAAQIREVRAMIAMLEEVPAPPRRHRRLALIPQPDDAA